MCSFLWEHLANDVRSLSTNLDRSEDDVLLAVHLVLSEIVWRATNSKSGNHYLFKFYQSFIVVKQGWHGGENIHLSHLCLPGSILTMVSLPCSEIFSMRSPISLSSPQFPVRARKWKTLNN